MNTQPSNAPHTRLDVDFHPAHVLRKYRVYLNGVELFDCQVADAEKGYVLRQRKHPLFGYLLREAKSGKIATRRCEGKVEIVLREPALGQTP